MDATVVRSGNFYIGQQITITGFGYVPMPKWLCSRWMKDGDRMLMRFLYGLVGIKLSIPLTVTAISEYGEVTLA